MPIKYKITDSLQKVRTGEIQHGGFNSHVVVPSGYTSGFAGLLEKYWGGSSIYQSLEEVNNKLNQDKQFILDQLDGRIVPLTTLTNYMDGQFTGFQTEYGSVINALGSFQYYGLGLNNNGLITGYSISTYNGTGGMDVQPISSFDIFADSFRIMRSIEAGEPDLYDDMLAGMRDASGNVLPAFMINYDHNTNSYNTYFNGRVSFSNLANNNGETIIDGGEITTDVINVMDKLIIGSGTAVRFLGAHANDSEANTYAASAGYLPLRNGDNYFNTTESTSYEYIDGTWTSTQGLSATLLRLEATTQAFKFNSEGLLEPTNQSVQITAHLQNIEGTATFTANPATSFTQVGNTITISAAQFGTKEKATFTASIGDVSDSLTVYRVGDGKDSITVILSNEAHTLPADSLGNITSYVGSGTTVKVFQGSELLTLDTNINSTAYPITNGRYRIALSSNNTSIPSIGGAGTTTATIGQHTSVSANTAQLFLAIRVRGLAGKEFDVVNKTQSLTKSIAGVDGDDGVRGALSSKIDVTANFSSWRLTGEGAWLSTGSTSSTVLAEQVIQRLTGSSIAYSGDTFDVNYYSSTGSVDPYQQRVWHYTPAGWLFNVALKVHGDAIVQGTLGVEAITTLTPATGSFDVKQNFGGGTAVLKVTTGTSGSNYAIVGDSRNSVGPAVYAMGTNTSSTNYLSAPPLAVYNTSDGYHFSVMWGFNGAPTLGAYGNNVAVRDKLEVDAVGASNSTPPAVELYAAAGTNKITVRDGSTAVFWVSATGEVNGRTSSGRAIEGFASTTGWGVYGNGTTNAGVVGSSINGTYGVYSYKGMYSANGYSSFTGTHDTVSATALNVGDIVDTVYVMGVNVDQSYAEVAVTTTAYSKKAYGVVSHSGDSIAEYFEKDPHYNTITYVDEPATEGSEDGEGHSIREMVFTPKAEFKDYIESIVAAGWVMTQVNALGEGMINVCEINGDIENGDYITSSIVPGKGMKQNDDLLHNYTVAKSLQDVVWADWEVGDKCYLTQGSDGVMYKTMMIACTYHCG